MAPKVRFKLNSIRNESDRLYGFCKPRSTGWDWTGYVFGMHPELKPRLTKSRTEKERKNTVDSYVKEYVGEEKELMKSQAAVYQKEWNRVNDRYMRVLSQILETDWPKERKMINAYVSINPICPRFLDQWSFSISMLRRLKGVRKVTSHEVLHFLYFKKWKEVFPNARRETYESPHLEWHLSEILAPIILGDPRIQRVIKVRDQNYPEHQKAMIGKTSVVRYFEDLYAKSRKRGDSFSRFLEIAYSEAKRNKSSILRS